MIPITKEQIQEAINAFLETSYVKKREKDQNQLAKAIADNDTDKISKLNESLSCSKQEYKDNWITYASDWMTTQLSFGTHLSKGIHSSSKGDNLIFIPKSKIATFAGHHSLIDPLIDASGNAAALPLASFLNLNVTQNTTLRDLISQKHPELSGEFHSDKQESNRIQNIFHQFILGEIKNPKTDGLNKQILWFTESNYNNIVPLYPISVVNYLYNIAYKGKRYSEENLKAKNNRGKTNVAQSPYITMAGLAVLNIGGSNPQGVSQLMSKQSGRNYLLPSLPPIFRENESIRISKNSKSIFNNKSLQYKVRNQFKLLFAIIKDPKNTVDIRDGRKAILDEIIYEILTIATSIQESYPAGWSKDYQLSMSEKYWLDPKRAELEDELDFKIGRETNDWQIDIQISFADWVQSVFQHEFKNNKHDFADPEHHEWQSEMKEAIKESIRLGQGVFA